MEKEEKIWMVLENETKNPGGDQGIRPMPAMEVKIQGVWKNILQIWLNFLKICGVSCANVLFHRP